MSTYSPSLRIELITTGTAAGTWGNTTNDNLSTVLDASIAGAISVTTSASSQALTYLNGPTSTAANNQAVRAALTLNTSTGADFAVYAPPVSKLYVIYNASSYIATIYNSTVAGNTTAAGTGVAVPAGKTMTVWSDGTNFSQQNTHLISPTLATPTLASPTMTGTPVAPTATSTDSSTTVATTAFVQAQKASPAFTGTPTAPTAAPGTNTTQIATTAFVQAAATSLATIYPVGSIYTSTVSTNPATLFGFGTWVAFGAGRVLIGDGGGFTAGSTGGSADAITVAHTHTASTSITDPGHLHTISGYGGGYDHVTNVVSGDSYNQPQTMYTNSATTGITASTTVNSTGSSGTNANLQPYVVVYMWNRTA